MPRRRRLQTTLKAEMRQAKITQLQLASHLGLSESAICNYVRGRSLPKLANAQKIAKLLGCSLTQLWPELDEQDFRQPKPVRLKYLLAAKQLKQARRKQGLTRQEVADQTELRLSTYISYERGQNAPKLEAAERLSKQLGIEVQNLYPMKRLRKGVSPSPNSDAGRLRYYREKAGLRGVDLARRLNLAQSTISSYEQAVIKVPHHRRSEYAKALRVTPKAIWQNGEVPEEWQPPATIEHSGHLVKIRRIKQKLTRSELAANANAPRQAIVDWEKHGRQPSLVNTHAILSRLGLEWKEVIEDPCSFPPRSGVRLKAYRRRAGLTMQCVAEELGVSRQRVSMLEGRLLYQPHHSQPKLLKRLAQVLGVAVSELWGEEEAEK